MWMQFHKNNKQQKQNRGKEDGSMVVNGEMGRFGDEENQA
jgi:hypothetical protein